MKRRRWKLIGLGVGVILLAFLYYQWQAAIKRNRSIPDPPLHIAGNLYSVGSTGVTSFLLTGPDGHILIDGGYPETAPLIIGSIRKLGFDIKDVKVLLNTHAHFDHAGGLKELQDSSGAQLWISEQDAPIVESGGKGDKATFGLLHYLPVGRFPAPRVDHRFKDGTVIKVGPTEVTANITPGHTPGCTSWSFKVHQGDRDLLAVDICSLTILPFMKLADPQVYPGIREDFERSFAALRAIPADIFLASHGSFFNQGSKRKAAATAANPADPFIDHEGYLKYIDNAEAAFRKRLAEQQK